MEPTKTNMLKAPGANLYYEVHGSGPVLLLICGGVYDAAGYAGLVQQLADQYTVVTYDRRGNSRSPLDGPPEYQRIEVHGDDAHRILEAVGVTGDEPAYVFGNSSGAEIGLELAARHPEQVRVLVAHEPPIFDVLPDREHWFALMQTVEDTFAREGAGPAGQIFAAGLHMRGGGDGEEDTQAASDTADQQERIPGGADAQQGEPDPEMLAMLARFEKNTTFFIGYEVPPFGRYVPDIAALRGSGVRVVPAAGALSAGEPPNRCALALAEQLGTEAVIFPSDHGGFGAESEAFAAKLREVLLAS